MITLNIPKPTAFHSVFAFALAAAFAVLPCSAAPKAATKKTAARVSADTITIINSGESLLPGYRVTVTPEGVVHGIVRTRTGRVTINRQSQMIGPTRDRLFRDLRAAMPLDQLSVSGAAFVPQNNRPRGGRGQRGGFGNRTTSPTSSGYTGQVTGPQVFVIYHGVRSPNLRAASDDSGKELYQRVKQAIELVRLPIPDVP